MYQKKITTVLATMAVTLLLTACSTSQVSTAISPEPGQQSTLPTTAADTAGKQIIPISVKGGYTPSSNTAKANTPSILRMTTKNTYDCSLALVIPALGVQKMLPRSGDTDIVVPPQQPGTVLNGSCSMGMYNFSVKFE
ncbi:MAG: cupredoxin domain-containing protein [bacterium]